MPPRPALGNPMVVLYILHGLTYATAAVLLFQE
jgi:hypothetical protein